MKISRVHRLHYTPTGFAKPILVEGKRAYRIPSPIPHHHYVRFVYPNSDAVLSAHPNDVKPFPKIPEASEAECAP